MKIVFIRPNLAEMRSSDALEPLALAVLAGLTPPDVEIAFYDDRLEPVPVDIPADLVALSVDTYTARRAYGLAAGFRRRGIPVVMGGYHPTLLPGEARAYADAVVIGDAEGVWPQLVGDARAGHLQRVYGPAAQSPAGLKSPDRRIFQGKRYAPLGLVQAGRGCRFACDFCSIHAFYGSRLLQRPVAEVAAEVEALGRRLVVLVDDNLFASPEQAEALFRALIPLRIHWVCQISIDVARDDHLLDLMARSGCLMALIGFESLDERNLAQMKKKWNLKHTDYGTAVQKFYDRGIMIYASFIFGHDYDTPGSFDAVLDFALRSKFALANFNPLMPMPGTALYDRLRAGSRLLYERWWLDPRFRYGQAVFRPAGMTAEQLAAGCFYARREFNRYGAIFRRLLPPGVNGRTWRHLSTYLAANLISRREIYNKQGRALGTETLPAVEAYEADPDQA